MFSSPSDIYAAPDSSLVIMSMIGEQPPRVLYEQCLIGWLIRPHNLCWLSNMCRASALRDPARIHVQ